MLKATSIKDFTSEWMVSQADDFLQGRILKTADANNFAFGKRNSQHSQCFRTGHTDHGHILTITRKLEKKDSYESPKTKFLLVSERADFPNQNLNLRSFYAYS